MVVSILCILVPVAGCLSVEWLPFESEFLDIKSLSHYSEWKTEVYDGDDRDIDFVCLAADLGKISHARFPHEILNNPFDFVSHTHTC